MTTIQAAARKALEDFERSAEVINRQLNLIGERAKGDYLDKRPVVQSLRLHAKRASDSAELLRTALAQQGEPKHIGDTRFEGWLSEYEVFGATGYIKQDMRNAYWAGYSERAAPAPQAQEPAPQPAQTGSA